MIKNLFLLLVVSMFSSKALAYFVPQYFPYLKYNSSKSHYLVSLPQLRVVEYGFTAVFNAQTKQLIFKTDKYFKDGYVFLSQSGKRLLQVQLSPDEKKVNCSLNTFTEKGEERSIDLFTKSRPENKHWKDIIYDIYTENDLLIVEGIDSVYYISTETLETTVSARITKDPEGQFLKFENAIVQNDSIFSIVNLAINNVALDEKLATDLDFHDELITSFRVEFSIQACCGAYGVIVDFPSPKSYPDDYMRKQEVLEKKIIELIESYRFPRGSVPGGTDFWFYEGVVQLR